MRWLIRLIAIFLASSSTVSAQPRPETTGSPFYEARTDGVIRVERVSLPDPARHRLLLAIAPASADAVVGGGVDGVGVLVPASSDGSWVRRREAAGPTARFLDEVAWVRAEVMARLPALNLCHARAFVHLLNRGGSVRLGFTVQANGGVTNARLLEIDPRLRDPGFQACLVQRLSGWVFPTRANGAALNVVYPLSFVPVSAAR